MHLQTADMRRPWWKVRNLHLGLFEFTSFIGLPVTVVFGVRSLLQGEVPLTRLCQAILTLQDSAVNSGRQIWRPGISSCSQLHVFSRPGRT
jgi:hypothetical protein